jgi:hypothetical protein
MLMVETLMSSMNLSASRTDQEIEWTTSTLY